MRLVHLLAHIGYFGPFFMGIMDSSFLILPFGNDFLVVGFIARNPRGMPGYVLMAACGSTIGAFLLASVSKKLGEQVTRKLPESSLYEKIKKRIGRRSGVAIAVAGLSPPPFPFTTVIAAVAAMGYSMWKLLAINFISRSVRFVILGLLALKYGRGILHIANSTPFKWSMLAFIALCCLASVFSVIHWLRKSPRKPKPASAQAAD